MTTELPEKPESREESYLASIAGEDVTLPDKPLSRKEQYLAYIAENGGGGGGGTSYTAGNGIDITNHTISIDDTVVQEKLTAGTGIDITNNTISATGGGGGDTVYSDKSTSNADNGGAVYIGNLNADQQEQADPTTTDNHYRYFYALPYENPSSSYAPKNGSINILGECRGEGSVVIGLSAYDSLNSHYQTVIGQGAHSVQSSTVAIGYTAGASAENSIAIGRAATVDSSQNRNSIALGAYSRATRKGEVNIGTNGYNLGYDNTDYRVIGGVHDPINAHDAATKGYVDNVLPPITVLDSSFFNYDSGSGEPDSVALWLLPTGFYVASPTDPPQVFKYKESGELVDTTFGIYVVESLGTAICGILTIDGAENFEANSTTGEKM